MTDPDFTARQTLALLNDLLNRVKAMQKDIASLRRDVNDIERDMGDDDSLFIMSKTDGDVADPDFGLPPSMAAHAKAISKPEGKDDV